MTSRASDSARWRCPATTSTPTAATRNRSAPSSEQSSWASPTSTPPSLGPYANEELVGRALNGRRDDVVLATKFGLVSHSGAGPGVLDSSPANIRTAVEGSLKRLGTDRIDLYYQHRVDPNTPIEDTVGALAELIAEGKVLHIGLSEAGPEADAIAHEVRASQRRPDTPR